MSTNAANEISLIDVLNDDRGREMVEGIEDTIRSLEGYDFDEPELERILEQQINELYDAFGYSYLAHMIGE